MWRKAIPNPQLKLLGQVQAEMRLGHYCLRTPMCYCDCNLWHREFPGMRSQPDLEGGTAKMEMFLSNLAVREQGGLPARCQRMLICFSKRSRCTLRRCG